MFASLQVVVTSLCEGESLVLQTSDLAHKVLPQTSPDGQETIKNQQSNIQQNLDNHAQKTKQTEKELDDRLKQWRDFDNASEEFNKWLGDMEKALEVTPELKVDLFEKKRQLEKYKVLLVTCLFVEKEICF